MLDYQMAMPTPTCCPACGATIYATYEEPDDFIVARFCKSCDWRKDEDLNTPAGRKHTMKLARHLSSKARKARAPKKGERL